MPGNAYILIAIHCPLTSLPIDILAVLESQMIKRSNTSLCTVINLSSSSSVSPHHCPVQRHINTPVLSNNFPPKSPSSFDTVSIQRKQNGILPLLFDVAQKEETDQLTTSRSPQRQGCCNSRPAHPDAEPTPPSPSTTHTPTRTSPTTTTSTIPNPNSRSITRRHSPSQPSGQTSLAQRSHRPLQRHRYTPQAAIGASRLITEREEFFDTRVTCRRECWEAVRMAVEVLIGSCAPPEQVILPPGTAAEAVQQRWEAEVKRVERTEEEESERRRRECRKVGSNRIGNLFRRAEEAPPAAAATVTIDEGLATAREILAAAGLTLPTGSLVDGVWDEAGGFYDMPEEVIGEPTLVLVLDLDLDLVEEQQQQQRATTTGSPNTASNQTSSTPAHESNTTSTHASFPFPFPFPSPFPSPSPPQPQPPPLADPEAARRATTAPAAQASIAPSAAPSSTPSKTTINVRCRLSGGEPDIIVKLAATDLVVSKLVQQIRLESGMLESARVKIAFMGKILAESRSLVDFGWKDGDVVSVLLVGL